MTHDEPTFSASDFSGVINHHLSDQVSGTKCGPDGKYISLMNVLSVCNAKLSQLLGPMVFGYIGEYGSSWTSHKPVTFIQENLTHTARLFNVQEIKKVECEHKNVDSLYHVGDGGLDYNSVSGYRCRLCGKKLTPTWVAE